MVWIVQRTHALRGSGHISKRKGWKYEMCIVKMQAIMRRVSRCDVTDRESINKMTDEHKDVIDGILHEG